MAPFILLLIDIKAHKISVLLLRRIRYRCVILYFLFSLEGLFLFVCSLIYLLFFLTQRILQSDLLLDIFCVLFYFVLFFVCLFCLFFDSENVGIRFSVMP